MSASSPPPNTKYLTERGMKHMDMSQLIINFIQMINHHQLTWSKISISKGPKSCDKIVCID